MMCYRSHRRLLCVLLLLVSSHAFVVPRPYSAALQTGRQHTFSSSSSSTDSQVASNNNNNNGRKDRALGVAVLLTVPLAWGTYTPVVKFLYEIQPPTPGFVFSAAYYTVAALTLWLLIAMQRPSREEEPTTRDEVPTLQADDEQDTENPASSRPALLFQGGAELGTYLFLGNLLQIIALKTVPADRAGFLVQTTTVMVPLVDAALTGRPVPAKTWLACLLAFAGVVVMNLNGDSGPFLDALSLSDVQEAFTSFSVGDALILLAAVSYSMHVVRLGGYAKELAPLNLAASKATVEATLSLCLVALLLVGADSFDDETSGLLAYATEAGHEIATFFATMKESLASDAIPSSALLPAVGAVFWTGWVTCAYTIYAQSFGQRRVQPVTANLIYTVQPLFTALFAWMLLGETLGPAGVAGGSFIAAAVYMVAMTDGSSQNDRAENSLASLGTEEDEAIENLTKINGETCQEFVER